MAFRLRDNTKIISLPNCEQFIGQALDDIVHLLEDTYCYHKLYDLAGKSDYRLITMGKPRHRAELLAFQPKNTDRWIIIDVFSHEGNFND